MSYDSEYADLERKIDRLSSRIDDLEYEIHRLKNELSDKADVHHSHSSYND